jgi:glycerophosphoryl diester phosphodiesterase
MTSPDLIAIACAVLLAAGNCVESRGQAMPGERPVVIAHRGASAYLPEHTLEAKALAHGMGADFLEQDVVLTKDDVPVVLHDIHLDAVTDVAEQFPARAREDGRFYAIDFTLAEIRTLRVSERFDRKTGRAVYPGRFPVRRGRFEVPTLAEEIELIQGLNRSAGRNAGIYPEIKAPAFHRRAGKDISRIVLRVLGDYGYHDAEDAIYVQCFDAAETRRLREELGSRLRLVQLIGENRWGESETDYDALRTEDGIRRVAEYANGIGPALSHVVTGLDSDGHAQITDLVSLAHRHGLTVHPYTFRADDLPDYARDFESLLDLFATRAGVDGFFTDHPDRAARFLQRHP